MPSTETGDDWKKRFRDAFDHLGRDAHMAARTHGRPDFTGSTWEEGLAWLRGGITAVHYCAKSNGRWPKHKVRFHADGSVELLAHPGAKVRTELMMGALSGTTPTCFILADALTSPDPAQATWPAGGAKVSTGRMRTLYAMVAWAQRADADWQAIAPLLRPGVTPVVLDAWLADGWTLEQAKPFLLAGAAREAANAWRAIGKFTHQAARLAAKGETPASDDEWTAAGFTASRAQRWRVAGLPLSPADCKALDDTGWSPTLWRQTLERSRYGRGQAGVVRALDATTLREWALAGIPPRWASDWWRETGGDLTQARLWAPTGINPHVLNQLQQSNLASVLTTENVRGWIAAGAHGGYVPSMRQALTCGLTPEQFAEVLAQHPHRNNRNWSFEDRLGAACAYVAARERFLAAGTPLPGQ